MKKILIQGMPNWKPIRQFGCISCGCVFETDEYQSSQFDGYSSVCPRCDAKTDELPPEGDARQIWIKRYVKHEI